MTITRVRFEACLARMSSNGTASISTTALSKIFAVSKADTGQFVASMPLTRRLAFALAVMDIGTSLTLITDSAKPRQPRLAVAACFKQAASPAPRWLRHEPHIDTVWLYSRHKS
jgi:hypothetical protein